MRSLAANLSLRGRSVLLVGAGAVGLRKLAYLLDAGAQLSVVEPEPGESVRELAREGKISLLPRFSPKLLEDSPVVFLALKGAAPAGLLEEAERRRLWVNVAGEPEKGNFTLPALQEDGPFRLAVSTGGASPALASWAAGTLKGAFPGCGDFCRLLLRLRPLILSRVEEAPTRREILLRLSDSSELRELLATGDLFRAAALVKELAEPMELPTDFSLDFLKE
ncbi:MAG: hypothetical protein LBR53_12915 [Deltaproteobacteria bacterium]|jgi:precorrin-2 dehydrogenase/sirohydrochlorin ferrochelatase|nr:hypothetical protein [Deltaproteobacteria bacterium]